jgi:hypothetical protein
LGKLTVPAFDGETVMVPPQLVMVPTTSLMLTVRAKTPLCW